jgi:hypothetical protein
VHFNTPVNVPYSFNAGAQVDYSTPIRSLGIIFTAQPRESYSKGSNIINYQDNTQTTFVHSLNLSIGNRNKQVWDLTTGASVSMNDTKFSISESLDNKFFNTTYFADFYITPTDQWSIDASANIVNYNSKNFDESVSIPLINASIGYYFLEGNKAGLTLQVHDLLNKYSGFERIATANYLMERERNNIGRYVMLTFNLRRGGRVGKGGGKR